MITDQYCIVKIENYYDHHQFVICEVSNDLEYSRPVWATDE